MAHPLSSKAALPKDDGDLQITFSIYFDWHKLWESTIQDAENPEKPIYLIKHVFGKNPDLTLSLKKATETSQADTKNPEASSAEGAVISNSYITKNNFDSKFTCHGRNNSMQLVLHNRHPAPLRNIFKWSSTALSTEDKPQTFTWHAVLSFRRWTWVCVDKNGKVVGKWLAHAWRAKKIGEFEFYGPSAHNEAFREEIITTGLLATYTVSYQISGTYRFFGSLGSKLGRNKGEKEEKEESIFESHGAKDDAMSTLSTTDTLAAEGNAPKKDV